MKKACVIVLGEVSQCPRMQFHALSLANYGYTLDFICYKSNSPYKELVANSNINFKILPPIPANLKKIFPRLILLFIKLIWDLISMISIFCLIENPKIIFVQNPPAITLIPLVKLFVLLKWKSTRILVDWHNYGYTIFKLNHPKLTLLSNVYEWLEHQIGKMVDYNICVSNAMKLDLKNNFNICALTLYDNPTKFFGKHLNLFEQHELFLKLFPLALGHQKVRNSKVSLHETLFTVETVKDDASKIIEYKRDRPALLISSTSWTEDEDFQILLNAIDLYDNYLLSNVKLNNIEIETYLPPIVLVITGKGPLKDYYTRLIRAKEYKYVDIKLLWLEPEDYPKLLNCADLGICLHYSSSGLDLPMKIVDMRANDLPVLAYYYDTLKEMVTNNKNGIFFRNPEDLFNSIKELLSGFPDKITKLQEMRAYIKNNKVYWEDNWNEKVVSLITPRDGKRD